jgi:hypothetical protein
MPKKMKQEGDPEVHEALKGFDIKINELGEIKGNYDIDQLNSFLNKEVDDKKLAHLSKDKSEEE